eukprot:Skav214518  [mRNA]  locus=scaffold410:94383:97082:+ [translate_table: standard]
MESRMRGLLILYCFLLSAGETHRDAHMASCHTERENASCDDNTMLIQEPRASRRGQKGLLQTEQCSGFKCQRGVKVGGMPGLGMAQSTKLQSLESPYQFQINEDGTWNASLCFQRRKFYFVLLSATSCCQL